MKWNLVPFLGMQLLGSGKLSRCMVGCPLLLRGFA